jgi:hypothetical protein
MKNLTYDQLIELAPKDRPFQIETDTLYPVWAYITDNDDLCTIFQEYTRGFWKTKYKGTFTLIDPRYQKPEVLKVGQKVRIMESARDIGEYGDMIGKIMTIHNVRSDMYGVYYLVKFVDKDMDVIFPHYCVMPVEEEEEIPERTLEDILFELSDEDKEIIKSKLK